MRRNTIILCGAVLLAGAPAVAQQASPPASPAARPAERRICKQSAEIGTLVQRRRECHTRAEWDRQQQAARATGQAMVENGTGAPQGGQ